MRETLIGSANSFISARVSGPEYRLAQAAAAKKPEKHSSAPRRKEFQQKTAARIGPPRSIMRFSASESEQFAQQLIKGSAAAAAEVTEAIHLSDLLISIRLSRTRRSYYFRTFYANAISADAGRQRQKSPRTTTLSAAWSCYPDSNWGPHPYQGCALPTEL